MGSKSGRKIRNYIVKGVVGTVILCPMVVAAPALAAVGFTAAGPAGGKFRH